MPSRRMPLVITRLISSSVQLPRPVALSDVRLPVGKSPNGSMRISMPPASFIPGSMRFCSSTGEWQMRAAERLDEVLAALDRVRPSPRASCARVERRDLLGVHRPDRLARERHDVVGEVPHLGVAGGVGERRHRRAGHAGAEAQIDVARRGAAVERPRFGEIGRAQRHPPVVFERRASPRRCRGRRCRGTCRTAACRTPAGRARCSPASSAGRRRSRRLAAAARRTAATAI